MGMSTCCSIASPVLTCSVCGDTIDLQVRNKAKMPQMVGLTSKVVKKFKIPFKCPECGGLHFPYIALQSFVFVFGDPVPEKIGSIFIPEMTRESLESERGTVLSVGKGYYDKQKKKFIPTTVKPGQRVVYDKTVPWFLMVKGTDGKNYKIKYMPEADIKGIIEEE
jgi:co-chaperonin GroES (HSP10)